jgi:hypothetical protein
VAARRVVIGAATGIARLRPGSAGMLRGHRQRADVAQARQIGRLLRARHQGGGPQPQVGADCHTQAGLGQVQAVARAAGGQAGHGPDHLQPQRALACQLPSAATGGTDAGRTARSIGIDRGVATTIATSDKQMLRAPKMRQRERAKLARLQREKARRGKGSARRTAVVQRIATVHETVADRRRDWVEKITTRIAANYDFVAVEHLPVRNMVRRPKPKPDPDNPGHYLPNGAAAKAGLNKGIYANCWGMFARRLGQKMKASGTTLVAVSARYSSQQCRKCGHTAKENRESQAVFLCVACGHGDHADHNAAEIILARARPARTPGPGATPQGVGTARCAHESENQGWAA